MATQNDQPRPDLDAAIDAVVPSLTAVSDEAVAASLRRTRIALADAAPRRESGGAWRWAVPAVAFTTVLVAVALWLARPAVDGPRDVIATAQRSATPAPLPAVRPAPVPPVAALHRAVRPQRLARAGAVRATSVPSPEVETPRADRLVDFVRSVQQIPEEAWSRSAARLASPVLVPDVSVTSIDVTPLDSPAEVEIEPLAPGEP